MAYWHNGRSLGHTAGCAAILRALRRRSQDADLVALTGAYRGLDLLPVRTRVLSLPPFRSADTAGGAVVEPSIEGTVENFVQHRAALIGELITTEQPDVLLVDHLPWGWRGEMEAAIEGLSHTRTVLMWRGVLFDAESTNRDYLADGRAEWIADNYDAIVVHNDPRIFNLKDEYRIPKKLSRLMSYSGYLAEPFAGDRDRTRTELGLVQGEKVMTITLGGGQGAASIWRTMLNAVDGMGFHRIHAVLGPYLEPDVSESIQRRAATIPGCTVVEYEPSILPWLAASDVVITAAGANALGEVLATRANAIAIPRQLRESEQFIHCGLLAERGWVRGIPLAELTVDRLRAEVEDSLVRPIRLGMSEVRLSGAAATAERVLGLVAGSG